MLPEILTRHWVELLGGVVIPIIILQYQSMESASEKQKRLSSTLLHKESEPEVTDKGNQFSLVITGVKVWPAEKLFYHYISPLIPVFGGFHGTTEVEIEISGDVYIEEWLLISRICQSDRFRETIADLRLKEDRLQVSVNSVDEEEIGEMMVGFRRMIERTNRYLTKDTISAADHKVLGIEIGDGFARPILVDVSYPTRLSSRVTLLPVINYIRHSLSGMNRTVVWERCTPYEKTSTIELRTRKVDALSDRYEITTRDLLRFICSRRASGGVEEIIRILHMGYRTHRTYVEEESIVEVNDAKCIALEIAQIDEKYGRGTDLARTKPGYQKLTIGFYRLNFSITSLFSDLRRKTIHVPIKKFNPRKFEKIDLTPVSGGTREDIEKIVRANKGGLDAFSVCALGDGVIEATYRGADWFFTIRFGEDGRGQVWNAGAAKPDEPLSKEGYVIWHKLHPGRETSYAPKADTPGQAGNKTQNE